MNDHFNPQAAGGGPPSPPPGRNKPGSEAPVAPAFVAPPELSGSGTIETPLIASAEVTGSPTPVLSFRWLRNEAPIGGAEDDVYTPTAADDLTAIRCRVSATNDAGEASAETVEVIARNTPPMALGLADRSFPQGSGVQSIAAAEGFAGAGLSFAIAGPSSLAIDSATGVVTVSTEAPFGPATVTVRASNSGGTAEAGFVLAVLAEDEDPGDDGAVRFDTTARSFDSTTARFDGAWP